MKNRLFYFAACVALALSSVSCSSDDGEDEDRYSSLYESLAGTS